MTFPRGEESKERVPDEKGQDRFARGAEEEVAQAFRRWRGGREGTEERAARIVRRARRELASRDLVVLSLARMWAALLTMGARLYALVARKT